MFRGLELLTSEQITQHKQLRIRLDTGSLDQTMRAIEVPRPFPLDKALAMGVRDKDVFADTCLSPHLDYLEQELSEERNDTRAAFSRLVGCIEEYMRRRCVGAGVPNNVPHRAQAKPCLVDAPTFILPR